MKAILLAPALLVSIMAFSPAVAAPVAPSAVAPASDSLVLGVQYRSDRGDYRDDRRPSRSHFRDRRRFDGPRGWHRFDRRPHDWNRRGCRMTGPVWFCP